jgi:hypothetical protein
MVLNQNMGEKRHISNCLAAVLLATAVATGSAIILVLRVRIVCPILGLRSIDLLPLFRIGHGVDPNLFLRVMHNLTHPVCLTGLVLPIMGSTFRYLRKRGEGKCARVFAGIAVCFQIAYLASLSFPIGDPVAVISNQ